MKLQNVRQKSELYYHTSIENFNCAQAVLKGFQNELDISDNEVIEFQAWGGGRADGGMCGALFAAERLLRQLGKESVIEEFNKNAGGVLCLDIKEKRFTCAEYVRIADELVQKSL
jgi:hypothetical protein